MGTRSCRAALHQRCRAARWRESRQLVKTMRGAWTVSLKVDYCTQRAGERKRQGTRFSIDKIEPPCAWSPSPLYFRSSRVMCNP